MANRPYVITENKKEVTCILINLAIPANRNIMQKGGEKNVKHKSLFIEIQRICNIKCMIIPVIIGATGMVKQGLKKNW